ncbi:hypothetical protein EASAB2608_03772 [Streptomyces sp. EAS-AB2608]|nr:hypothetical protein EASAB2608_03772 [Streptomyces sp. EAS-AB2608]
MRSAVRETAARDSETKASGLMVRIRAKRGGPHSVADGLGPTVHRRSGAEIGVKGGDVRPLTLER